MKKLAPYSSTTQMMADAGIFACSLALAYVIRFDGHLDAALRTQFLVCLPWMVGARLLLTWKGGVYRLVSQYFSLPDVMAIGQTHVSLTAVLLVLRFFYPFERFAYWLRLPLSIIALEFLLSLAGLLSVRTLLRTRHETAGNGKANGKAVERRRVLLYGAGSAGISLWKQLKQDHNAEVVGFIDDDPAMADRSISGLRVLGDGEALGQIIARHGVHEVIITIANCSRSLLTRILAKCQEVQIPAKVVPSVEEIMQGSAALTQVRDVGIELVLGRDGVRLQDVKEQVRDCYSGKRILVTGAGGSIGSELVRQLLLCRPQAVALLDKDENSLYELEQELLSTSPGSVIECHVVDMRIPERLYPSLLSFRPEAVFHAAAHKHVPLMEKDPCEAVINNVYGTQVLLEACCHAGVERFLFISTDKAVNPTSIMGATKRVGESLVQHYANGPTPKRFACVRFGNVVGSRGSIIPLFHRQIASGGPITVTHPDMVRYFMSIPEAVQLVLHAGSLGKQGEVFVLELGTPRKIIDVAYEIARLSGLEPGKDIEIVITGLRPGEKLTEELFGSQEQVCPTGVDKLSMIVPSPLQTELFLNDVASLVACARANDVNSICHILSSMKIGFRPKCRQCLREFAVDARGCEFCTTPVAVQSAQVGGDWAVSAA
jgi:FlaA1/EpsC-like NDP-sugar epimerase